MITWRNIHIAYDRVLLEQEEITLDAGCLTLLHGPSSIGKSALLYRIALMTLDCEIESDDMDLSDIEKARREDAAFVMQGNDLPLYMEVREICREYARIGGFRAKKSDILQALATVSLDVPLDQKIATLSLGERQRLCIACALMKKPRLLVLDEPTASLDKENKALVFGLMQRIAREGRYVVFSSHEEEAKDYADAIYGIQDRRLVIEKQGKAGICLKTPEKHAFDAVCFIANHIRSFAEKNKIQILYCNMFTVLSALSIACILAIRDATIRSSVKELYEMSDKYLYVTDRQNEGYVDKDSLPVDLEDGYPVYRMRLLDVDIPVVPYFDEMDYSDKLERRQFIVDNGLFVSFQAYRNSRDSISFYNGMELNVLTDHGPGQWTGTYYGVLKQGVKVYAASNPDEYAAMHYKDIEALSLGRPIGRIVFYDSLEKAQEGKEEYERQGYKVNADAIKYENIRNVANVQHASLRNAVWVVIMISCMLLIAANMANIRKREKEFAILRTNGITGSVCAVLIGMENVFALGIVFLVVSVASMALLAIGEAGLIMALWTSLGSVVAMHGLICLMNAIFLRNLNIERIFRSYTH